MTAPSPEAPIQGTETSPTTGQKVLRVVGRVAQAVSPTVISDIIHKKTPDNFMGNVIELCLLGTGAMGMLQGSNESAAIGFGGYAFTRAVNALCNANR